MTTTPHPEDMPEREAFEKWRRQNAKTKDTDTAVARDGFGDDADYAHRATQSMWLGWQARASLAEQRTRAMREEDDASDEWRRLALQFDGHRMQALGLIRYAISKLIKGGIYHDLREKLIEFNAAPPPSGEAVLAERIAALTPPSAPGNGEADAEDAARYRHLKECNSSSLMVIQVTGTFEDDYIVLTGGHADEAIDAAMKLPSAPAQSGGQG